MELVRISTALRRADELDADVAVVIEKAAEVAPSSLPNTELRTDELLNSVSAP